MTKLTRLCAIYFFIMVSACSMHTVIKNPDYYPVRPIVPELKKQADGAIYDSSNNLFLFEDVKARRVGDMITVILQESTNASKNASTSTKKSSSIDMPDPTLLGRSVTRNGQPILSTDANSNTEFSGEGGSSQSNSLSGNLTVTVAEVLPNGYLHVKGEKILTLNQGSEVVRISGIIRPYDITTQNTVLSSQIAAAEITYSGKGAIAGSNEQGWLTRFFNSSWWPF